MALPPPGVSDEVQHLLYLLARGQYEGSIIFPVVTPPDPATFDQTSEEQRLWFVLAKAPL